MGEGGRQFTVSCVFWIYSREFGLYEGGGFRLTPKSTQLEERFCFLSCMHALLSVSNLKHKIYHPYFSVRAEFSMKALCVYSKHWSPFEVPGVFISI